MSIAKNASRFDFLVDDADDPFQTAKKSNKKKDGGSGSGDAKKKAAKKGGTSDKKQLQNLAFGSVSEGKKKSKVQHNQAQQNGSSTSLAKSECEAEALDEKVQGNGNSVDKNPKRQRPKGISDEQWDEWQKRDADYTDETYATDLQTALLQSQLEYETEQKTKTCIKGKKKKPVAVSLTEFNARLTEGATPLSSTSNGTYNPTVGGVNKLQQPSESDEELVERFRMEARIELERERQKAIQRQILMSREPPPPMMRPSPDATPMPSNVPTSHLDEKDLIINTLTEENVQLKSEVDLLRSRVKSINNYLQAAQEVKDKAKLIYELENLTKANSELTEELQELTSQLEQEKSRSGAAMMELRRLLENRRRTNTEGSTT